MLATFQRYCDIHNWGLLELNIQTLIFDLIQKKVPLRKLDDLNAEPLAYNKLALISW